MKKYAAAIVFTVLACAAVNSWAATTNDQILTKIPVTLKGTLTDKTKVTEATVGGSLSFAEVQFIRGTVTGTAFSVIGNSISLLTTTNGPTNTVLQGRAVWTEKASIADSKGKFASAFEQDVFDLTTGVPTNALNSVISNSVLFVQGTEKEGTKGTNLNAKVEGIWKDGSTAVKASIKNIKSK